MAIPVVNVDDSSPWAYLQPKSVAWSEGWWQPGSESTFTKWTGWTPSVALVMMTAPSHWYWHRCLEPLHCWLRSLCECCNSIHVICWWVVTDWWGVGGAATTVAHAPILSFCPSSAHVDVTTRDSRRRRQWSRVSRQSCRRVDTLLLDTPRRPLPLLLHCLSSETRGDLTPPSHAVATTWRLVVFSVKCHFVCSSCIGV